jgi:predicted dehydrogenase
VDKVKLGLMCPGVWGRTILDSTKEAQRVTITACASRKKDTAVTAAGKYDVKAVESFDRLLKEDIQGVVITCPHHLHAEYAIAAAEAGKHVFLEKPIANTVKEAFQIKRACSDSGVVLMVGHVQRRFAACRTAKRMIDSGDYGAPRSVIACAGMRGVEHYGLGHWLLDGVTNPGGSLDMMAVHFAETLQYLIGPIEVVSGFELREIAGTTIPEVAAGIFQFKNKCIGYLGSYYVAPYNSFLTIYCERAVFYIDKFGRELFLQESRFPTIERLPVKLDKTPFDNPIREQFEEFGKCILGNEEPETGADEAIAALAAIRGIMVSAQEGRPVSIEEQTHEFQPKRRVKN